MSIEFNIDLKSQRKIFTVTDEFCFPDFFQAWRQALLHQNHAQHQCMIWDLSNLNAACLMESDLQRIAQFMQGQNMVDRSPINVALIAPTKATYGLARTYLNYIINDQEHFSIFRDKESAEQWLNSRRTQRVKRASATLSKPR